MMLAGAILTALGILALLFGSGIYFTSHEKLPYDSRTQVTVPQDKVISIHPLVGGLTLAGGIVLMVVAARK
jgi:hypothetical protein